MNLHVSRSTLIRVLSAAGAQPEVEATFRHLRSCRLCQDLAASVAEELRSGDSLPPLSKRAKSLLCLLEEEELGVLEELRAAGWWAGLKGLAPAQQREQIGSVLALQTPHFFEAVLADASLTGPADPHAGEVTALTARFVADRLPCPRYSQALKNDLQGRAMMVAGNCRRLAADWPGSHAALKEAGHYLQHGTGDPQLAARLLAISASLMSDTGNFEAAERLLAQAAEKYRACGDDAGLADVAVKEASGLLASCRFAASLERAELALKSLPPGEPRLEMLARSIVTECLIELGQPAKALRNYLTTLPLYQQHWVLRTRLRVGYLQARLLDAFGFTRESAKAFRAAIKGHLDEELYKSAFIYTLTFLDSLVKRGDLEAAAELCEETAGLLDTPLCHAQMKYVWDELLAQIRSRALTAARILEVRFYVLRHWSVPAARLPFQAGAAELAQVSAPLVLAELEAAPQAEVREELALPPSSSLFAEESYWEKLDRCDRELIAAALAETGGAIRTTARLLGISRNFLRTKIKKYGLEKLVH